MLDFAKQHKRILSEYSDYAKISLDLNNGYSARLKGLLWRIVKDPKNWDRYSKMFSIFVKAFPIITGIISSAMLNWYGKEIGLIIALLFGVIYIALAWLELYVPKDLAMYQEQARLLETERLVSLSAMQINFYSYLYNIVDTEDNEEQIQKLSKILDVQITAAISAKLPILIPLLENKRNSVFRNSEVIVSDVPKALHQKLVHIAEKICFSCTTFFGPGNYIVKIYYRTKHVVQTGSKSVNAEMLTSLIKYPRTSKPNSTNGGRSFLYCMGDRATVWDCANGRNRAITKSNEPKGDEGATSTYASMAYIRLPEGIGVLTIESTDTSTFNESNSIPQSVWDTLSMTTNILTRNALHDFENENNGNNA
jgi:hypothetical protein